MHSVCGGEGGERVCVRLHVCHSFSLMQRYEVHGNASELTTWDHQVRMIYRSILAYMVRSSVKWSYSNKGRRLAPMTDAALVAGKHTFIAV